ncbi:hypothetical protein D1643_01015 [Enterorhabdus sp. P55]|nr:hypothetical protein [Enterorhabdus sp. P55]
MRSDAHLHSVRRSQIPRFEGFIAGSLGERGHEDAAASFADDLETGSDVFYAGVCGRSEIVFKSHPLLSA